MTPTKSKARMMFSCIIASSLETITMLLAVQIGDWLPLFFTIETFEHL